MIHVVNKGKEGEREVRTMFKNALHGYMDTDLIQRNHQQAERGGADLVGVPMLAVEIKRVKKINWAGGLDTWWAQACEQAEKVNREPCLVFRENFGKWFVMLYALPWVTGREMIAQPMIMRWEDFEQYMEEHLVEHFNHVDVHGPS